MKKLLLISALLLLLSATLFSSEIRLSAQWEPSLGTLIRWPLGIPIELVVELAADDMLYVLVENANQQSSAQSTFSAANVNLDNCEFIFAPTNSHWTRDWGPHNIFDADDNWAIVDPLFDGYPWVPGDRTQRDYDDDEAVNQVLAEYFGTYASALPVYLTGGNLINDGLGQAFSTIQMYHESSHLYSQRDFLEIVQEYTGITDYHFLLNIEDYGIQHIDCGAKLLDAETVLIKELPEWHSEYARMEAVADYFRSITNSYGRNYNIHRIFCDTYSGTEAAAYTNSYILNKKILVPLFGIAADADALETYQQLMPGYEVIGIYYDAWYYYDALHCRTREILDPDMLYLQHRPLDDQVEASAPGSIEVEIIAYSNAALIAAETNLHWRLAGDEPWQSEELELTATDNIYQAEFPQMQIGAEIEYYIAAADESGRQSFHPIAAPEALHRFTVIETNSAAEQYLPEQLQLKIFPNPFQLSRADNLALSWQERNLGSEKELKIYNLKGQLVRSLSIAASVNSANWDGKDQDKQTVASGIYLLKLNENDQTIASQKIILLK
ncbi:MAG: agmatine deiminase family protein [Candidatus Cloacimonadales bacterium]